MQNIVFTSKGIYCPPGDFYIDPWKPVERAVITHAHADHARQGMQKYLCHEHSLPLLRSRISTGIIAEALPYGKSITINGVSVSLHPAGHVIGSAQVRIEYKGYTTVISGDYKRQDDRITPVFEVVPCHEFVTESTFGLPVYRWEPPGQMVHKIRKWVLDNQRENKTSVFMAYSLGKSQRIMKLLDNIAPVYLHSSVIRINKAISDVGIALPDAKPLDLEKDKKNLPGKVVILPPAFFRSPSLKKIPSAVFAICSGWMKIRGNRRWQSADAGFAISDHADWDDLLTTVKETGAEKVWVTHGYTNTFARYLSEKGLDARVAKTEFGENEE